MLYHHLLVLSDQRRRGFPGPTYNSDVIHHWMKTSMPEMGDDDPEPFNDVDHVGSRSPWELEDMEMSYIRYVSLACGLIYFYMYVLFANALGRGIASPKLLPLSVPIHTTDRNGASTTAWSDGALFRRRQTGSTRMSRSVAV